MRKIRMPKAPPTFNAISLETADRRYKEEPGTVSANKCLPSKIIKVYNRSKYHIKIEIEHVPKPSFITSLMCGFIAKYNGINVGDEIMISSKLERLIFTPLNDVSNSGVLSTRLSMWK